MITTSVNHGRILATRGRALMLRTEPLRVSASGFDPLRGETA